MFDDYGEEKDVWDLNKMQEEQYLVKLLNFKKLMHEWVFVSSRQELSELINLLGKDKYSLVNVVSLYNASTFAQFKKDQITKNKPDDLNFGGLN